MAGSYLGRLGSLGGAGAGGGLAHRHFTWPRILHLGPGERWCLAHLAVTCSPQWASPVSRHPQTASRWPRSAVTGWPNIAIVEPRRTYCIGRGRVDAPPHGCWILDATVNPGKPERSPVHQGSFAAPAGAEKLHRAAWSIVEWRGAARTCTLAKVPADGCQDQGGPGPCLALLDPGGDGSYLARHNITPAPFWSSARQ